VRIRQRILPFVAVAAASAAVLPATPVRAQSAGSVLKKALDRYESQMKGVNNYTVTMTNSMMSQPYTAYYVKKMVDGHPVFVMPEDSDKDAQAAGQWGNPYELLPKIASRARVQGHRQVDGFDTYVVQVDDLSGIDFGQESLGASQDIEVDPKSMTLYLDSKDYLVRQMHMEGTLTRDSTPNPFSMTGHLSDYRNVKGLMQPYKMTISIQGMTGAISDSDRVQAQAALQQWQQRLKNMPAAQRQAMEQMMGPQMKKMQQMLDSGTMDFTMQVTDVRVNEGPPKDAGAGGH